VAFLVAMLPLCTAQRCDRCDLGTHEIGSHFLQFFSSISSQWKSIVTFCRSVKPPAAPKHRVASFNHLVGAGE
jgi:hypothetical protein